MLGRIAFRLLYQIRGFLARRLNRRYLCVLKDGVILHPLYLFHLAAPAFIVLPPLLLSLNLSLSLPIFLIKRILLISQLHVMEHFTLVDLFKLSL